MFFLAHLKPDLKNKKQKDPNPPDLLKCPAISGSWRSLQDRLDTPYGCACLKSEIWLLK